MRTAVEREKSPRETQTICQLKITLQEIKPPIWRRIQVPAEVSLRELHQILQIVMTWQDYHLYQFDVGGTYYGEPDPDDDYGIEVKPANRTKLRTVAPRLGAMLLYEYDLGDDWKHDVLVEGLLLPEEGAHYPRCLAGARARPPEDCGGVPGYEELLEIIRDPEHEEYEGMMQWLGGSFDPEAFDLEAVNGALRFRGDPMRS